MPSDESPPGTVLEATRTPVAEPLRSHLVPAATSERLLSLDLMRGYFVFVLAAVHLNYVPSFFGWFDGRGVLWTSEAEGFFLISGMLVAILGRRSMERGGLGLATRRAWRRAGQLYVVACSLTLVYTAFGRFATDQGWPGVKIGLDTDSSWLEVIGSTLTLRYVYGWADFLTFYVPLFLLAPLILWALRRRLDLVVVAASLAAFASLTWFSAGAASSFLQWQAPFVLGAVIGFRFTEIRAAFAAMSRTARICASTVAIAAALAMYGVGMLMLYRPDLHQTEGLYDVLLGNERLGLLRPIVCVVTFAGGYLALEYLRRPIMATVGPTLELFGRNSLYVYVAQSIFVFTIPFILQPQGLLVNTAMDFALIAIIWIGLRKQFLVRFIPR